MQILIALQSYRDYENSPKNFTWDFAKKQLVVFFAKILNCLLRNFFFHLLPSSFFHHVKLMLEHPNFDCLLSTNARVFCKKSEVIASILTKIVNSHKTAKNVNLKGKNRPYLLTTTKIFFWLEKRGSPRVALKKLSSFKIVVQKTAWLFWRASLPSSPKIYFSLRYLKIFYLRPLVWMQIPLWNLLRFPANFEKIFKSKKLAEYFLSQTCSIESNGGHVRFWWPLFWKDDQKGICGADWVK